MAKRQTAGTRKKNLPKVTEKERRTYVRPYDAAAKQLLACAPILAYVLKNTVDELADYSIEEIACELIDGEVHVSDTPVDPRGVRSPLVLGLRNEDCSIDEGTITYDMILRIGLPFENSSVGIVINIEPQSYETDYPVLKRALYYCARMLSAQRGFGRAGSDYGALEKVYSIWLFTGPDSPSEGSVTTYAFHEQTVQGSMTHRRSEYDLAQVVFVRLPQAGGYNGFLEKLATLFSLETSGDEKYRVLESELTWGRKEAEAVVGRLVSMGEYALEYGIEKGYDKGFDRGIKDGMAQGLEQGLEQGLQQGLEQGLQQGRDDATATNIQALMANMSWDAERAMDALGIAEMDRQRYRELLGR